MAHARPMSEGKGGNSASAVRGTGKAHILNGVRRGDKGLSEQAQRLADSFAQQAMIVLSDQKDVTADSLDSIADAVRETGFQLRRRNQPITAEYAEAAASRVERFSQYLRDRDVDDLIDDVGQFARRQPAALVGGAFLIGLLSAHFLKTSSQREEARDSRRERATLQSKSTRSSKGRKRTGNGSRRKPVPKSTQAPSQDQRPSTSGIVGLEPPSQGRSEAGTDGQRPRLSEMNSQEAHDLEQRNPKTDGQSIPSQGSEDK